MFARPSAQAKRLCPEAIWTPGHFDRYREMSARVMAILADETPFVDRVSIDEAFFDISPGRFCDEHPIQIAQRISRRVSELGVTCSIGLGRNKTVAKIASERDKPRGLTIVTPGTEHGFLAPLPVRAMSGIGAAAESALARVGIRTLGQLAEASDGLLSPIFGINTELVRRRAAGLEVSEVRAIDAPDDVKSISNERYSCSPNRWVPGSAGVTWRGEPSRSSLNIPLAKVGRSSASSHTRPTMRTYSERSHAICSPRFGPRACISASPAWV